MSILQISSVCEQQRDTKEVESVTLKANVILFGQKLKFTLTKSN